MAGKIGKEKTLNLFFEGYFEPSGKHPFRNGIVTAEEALKLGIVDGISLSLEKMDARISEIAESISAEYLAYGEMRHRQRPELRVYKMMPE